MIYLTSDLLLGRDKVVESRGFRSAEEMENDIVKRWNETVREDDIVYHLGNFSWEPISAETVLPFLNGTIYFVMGPYDGHVPSLSLVKAGRHHVVASAISILRNAHVKHDRRTDFVLSHWPLADWPGREERVVHAHGGAIKTDLASCAGRFSVNCEGWGLKPIALDALVEFSSGFADENASAVNVKRRIADERGNA